MKYFTGLGLSALAVFIAKSIYIAKIDQFFLLNHSAKLYCINIMLLFPTPIVSLRRNVHVINSNLIKSLINFWGK